MALTLKDTFTGEEIVLKDVKWVQVMDPEIKIGFNNGDFTTFRWYYIISASIH